MIEFGVSSFQVFWVYLGVLSTTHRDEARREMRNPSENLPETWKLLTPNSISLPALRKLALHPHVFPWVKSENGEK